MLTLGRKLKNNTLGLRVPLVKRICRISINHIYGMSIFETNKSLLYIKQMSKIVKNYQKNILDVEIFMGTKNLYEIRFLWLVFL